jgi:uncharacterized membrane protein
MPEPLHETTPPDPELIGEDKFEPSVTTLRAYYGTRKRPERLKFSQGGFKLPGLFDTQDYYRDRTMFLFAMLLELIGVAFLGQVLFKASTLSRLSTAAVAAIFVIGDLLLAWLHTEFIRPEQCRLENERLRVFPHMRDGKYARRPLKEYLELDEMLLPSWRAALSFLTGALIIASAVAKAFVFYIHWQDIQFAQAEATGMPLGDNNYGFVISALVLLSYIVVAIIHYFFTGYYLHGLRQRHNEKKDRAQRASDVTKEYCLAYDRIERLPSMDEFIKQAGDSNNQHAEFFGLCPRDETERNALRSSTTPYATMVTRNRYHRINRGPDAGYQIVATGLLRDADLIELVNAQPSATAKAAVALYGHHLQMRIMQDARPRDEASNLTRHDGAPRTEAA